MPQINLNKLRKDFGYGQQKVADELGISVGTYSKIERGDIQLTVERLLHLSDFFNLSPEEVIYYDSQNKGSLIIRENNIRFIPVSAQAGLFSDFSNENISEDIIPFFLPIFYEQNLFMINLEGDSMYPTFCSGDYIIIKEHFLENNIRWGEPYLIISNSGQVVKRIFKSKDESKLLLKSDNELYESYEVNLSKVLSMWEVKGVLSKNLTPSRI